MSTEIAVVIISPQQRQLNVLLARSRAPNRSRWTLPHSRLRGRESLDGAADRVCRSALSTKAKLMRQVRAIETGRSEPSVAIGYLAVCPGVDGEVAKDSLWVPVADVRTLPPYQRTLIANVVEMLRTSDDPSIAFAMLPPHFTLAELQRVNEMISGRKLHKASFRRSLFAAKLVKPTDAQRAEGRGRPARLFLFAGRDA